MYGAAYSERRKANEDKIALFIVAGRLTLLRFEDLRTNQRFTLKERPMTSADLRDFVACFRSGRRFERQETDRFKKFPLATLLARDKLNLDIFWLKDDALDDPDLLPPPAEAAAEIVESLETALERFRSVAKALGEGISV
jgi:type I restriction enzyme M protein